MNRFTAALALLALAACTPGPKPGSPEAAVTGIYDTLARSKGDTPTPVAAIPMTADLKALVDKAEASTGAGEPVFDFDLAGNCQDCTGFNSLKVGAAPEDQTARVIATHKAIEARFKTGEGATGAEHAVYWDMAEEGGAWRVDNIVTADFDLRGIAETIVTSAAADAAKAAEGDAAVECATYVGLQSNVATKSDQPKFQAAREAWIKKAEAHFSHDELAQYLASSQAVLDDTPPAELVKLANGCLDKLVTPQPAQ